MWLPIASCTPSRLASGDAGAGEARYWGMVGVADVETGKSASEKRIMAKKWLDGQLWPKPNLLQLFLKEDCYV